MSTVEVVQVLGVQGHPQPLLNSTDDRSRCSCVPLGHLTESGRVEAMNKVRVEARDHMLLRDACRGRVCAACSSAAQRSGSVT